MACSASEPDRPTAACVSSVCNSRPASTETSRRSSASPATCLYRLGWRTPDRAATAARVMSCQPISSARSAPAAAIAALLSPALGTGGAVEPAGEIQHDGRRQLRELGLRVVTRIGDHLVAAVQPV